MHTNAFGTYTITPTISREQFDRQKFLDRRLYEETAKTRFNLLDREYPLFSKDDDKYPLHGNALLARSICSRNPENWHTEKEIVILDVGAAGGAITSLFVMNEMLKLGLLDKVRLVLVDISKDALEASKKGYFEVPIDYLLRIGVDIVPYLNEFKQKLAQAEIHIDKAYGLRNKMKNIADICVSGFTHHHMNIWDKELACRTMEFATRTGGIIGLVDEHMTYEDYVQWLDRQLNRRNYEGRVVPIAVESFIEPELHQSMFRQTGFGPPSSERYFYYFTGTKMR